jgi:hypothetical protein
VTLSQCSDGPPPPDELGAVLGRLTAAGTSWFAAVPPRAVPPPAGAAGLPGQWRDDATVIDATDRRHAPLTVNPFEPAPACPVPAHADRLAALLETAFRPPGLVRTVVRLALRRAYAEAGWDQATGGAQAGAVAPPCVPSVGDLRRTALAAVTELGGDARMRAAVRGFVDVRLGSLWLGPAGHFLAGGHPADVPRLLRRNVLFTVGEVIDDEAAAFLTGVLLIRVAEQLRATAGAGGPGAREPGAVVIAVPDARLRRLLDEIRSHGAEVIHAAYLPPGGPLTAAGDGSAAEGRVTEDAANGAGPHSAPRAESSPVALSPVALSPVALLGRRSAACGLQCRQRPCSGYELHEARLLAGADSQVWFRLWGQALVLAFLTGQPLPRVPTAVRRTWPLLEVRTRECMLATVVQGAVAPRALALRHSYDPSRLTEVAASTAAGLLAAATPRAPVVTSRSAYRTPLRAGQVWVIPQLRWLHEASRLFPPGQRQVSQDDVAPPLDFDLAGLPDWPGIRVGDRLDGLRRHRLSMASERNRMIAATALLGAEDGAGFQADLALAGIGLRQRQRLSYVARLLGAGQHGTEPGWLEVVLSWPSRLIQPYAGLDAGLGADQDADLDGELGVPEAATG